MAIFVKLALRNLMRNKRRTLIASLAIGVGLAALIFTDALMLGMKDNLIESATETYLGDGQIHYKKFRESFDVELTVAHSDSLLHSLASDSRVSGFSERAMSYAMITAPTGVASVTMIGVNPPHEARVSDLEAVVTSGNYFNGDSEQDVLIGSELARTLELQIGDRVVLTVAQAFTGDLSQEMFRVSGVYHFNVEQMDRGMAFIRLPRAQKMLNLPEQVHEIALDLSGNNLSLDTMNIFWSQYSQFDNEARSWMSLLPEMRNTLELTNFSTFIIGVILFAIVALGIVNTLFMSLNERMFEFGVMRAVGTGSISMATLTLYEAAALATISCIVGIATGWGVTALLTVYGIDYTGIEMSGVTFRELLFPVMNVKQFTLFPLVVYAITVVTGLYPAISVARLSPAEAMRRSF